GPSIVFGQPKDNPDPRHSRMRGWNCLTDVNNDLWPSAVKESGFDPQLGLAPPSNRMPMQGVSADIATRVSRLCGFRLPTTVEWTEAWREVAKATKEGEAKAEEDAWLMDDKVGKQLNYQKGFAEVRGFIPDIRRSCYRL